MSEPRKIRVAILFGGRSAEHEISLLSAQFVFDALDRQRFDPVLVGIDKSGRWRLQKDTLLSSGARDPRLVHLDETMPDVRLLPPSNAGSRTGESQLAVDGRNPLGVDVVFPVLHGPMGEDGTVQGLLELAGVPYVGSGVLGSAVGMDKEIMKRLLRDAEIPIVAFRVARRAEWDREPAKVAAILEELGFPMFVKPANLGSSVGVRRATDRRQLEAAIGHAFEFDTKIVGEKGIPSAREIECSVLGNDEPIASLPGEIVVTHADGFYSYAAKYIDESGARMEIPAALGAAETAAVQLLAIRTFRALEAEGMARIDFFLSRKGELYVNEINTIPGFTAISMYPKLWEASGIAPRELVTRLVELALDRARRRAALKRSV